MFQMFSIYKRYRYVPVLACAIILSTSSKLYFNIQIMSEKIADLLFFNSYIPVGSNKVLNFSFEIQPLISGLKYRLSKYRKLEILHNSDNDASVYERRRICISTLYKDNCEKSLRKFRLYEYACENTELGTV